MSCHANFLQVPLMKGSFFRAVLLILTPYCFGQSDSLLVHKVQRSLFITLGAWSGVGIGVGSYQVLSRQPSPWIDMGYQNLAWGAINGAIAGIGYWRSRTVRSVSDWGAERRKLRRVLWINAGLDMGYMLVGGYLASRSDARLRGTGYGILLQGGGLFLIDSYHAWRLRK